MALQAKNALETVLPGVASQIDGDLTGGGNPILQNGWTASANPADDHAVLTIGQLKALAHPFHARLSAAVGNQWMNDHLLSRGSQPTGSTVTDTAHHFTYDDAGNIASKQVETSGTAATMTTYSHNSLNQVTAIGGTAGPMPVIVRGDTDEPATVEVKSGATGSAWKNARMLSGNRFESDLDLAAGSNAIDVRATDGSSNVANYTYSLTLAAATAAAPAYDADGNMTSDGVRGYEWDAASKLTKVTWGGSPVLSTEYRYNALGQRSERIEKSGTTETAHYYYLYQGIRLLCRYSGGTAAANIDRQYLSQGEQRKISSAWSSYYYNRDHLGSIREVMNADGTLAARYDYTPYGIRRVQYEATAYAGGCDIGFTGHITQLSPVSGQSELVLTHFRGYDPELGRWLSADPIGESGGLNLYGYVANNPEVFIDPEGRFLIPLFVMAFRAAVTYVIKEGGVSGLTGAITGGVAGVLASCSDASSGSGFNIVKGVISGGIGGLVGGVVQGTVKKLHRPGANLLGVTAGSITSAYVGAWMELRGPTDTELGVAGLVGVTFGGILDVLDASGQTPDKVQDMLIGVGVNLTLSAATDLANALNSNSNGGGVICPPLR